MYGLEKQKGWRAARPSHPSNRRRDCPINQQNIEPGWFCKRSDSTKDRMMSTALQNKSWTSRCQRAGDSTSPLRSTVDSLHSQGLKNKTDGLLQLCHWISFNNRFVAPKCRLIGGVCVQKRDKRQGWTGTLQRLQPFSQTKLYGTLNYLLRNVRSRGNGSSWPWNKLL